MSNKTKNVLILLLTAVVLAATAYVLIHKPKSTSDEGTLVAGPASGSASAQASAPASGATAASATPRDPSATPSSSSAPGAAASTYLRLLSKTGKPRVAFLGSSLTAGCCTSDFGHTWPYLVQRKIETTIGPITVLRHVYPGTSLPNILAQGGVKATIADKPDLVLLETSGTNDCGQGVTVAKSQTALASALTQLRQGLPKALIVVQTSSPKTDPKLCAGGLTYPQFMADQASFLQKQKGVLFFDLYTAMSQAIGKHLSPYMHDQTHPNDAGAAVWAKLLEAYLGL